MGNLNARSLKGRHFISLRDFTGQEIDLMLRYALDLKVRYACGERPELLKGKTLGMVFARPSTRTRVSFETAMTQLGGHAQYLAVEGLQLSKGPEVEPVKDFARVMSRYVDGMAARIEAEELLELAQYSTVPVVSASHLIAHPCQAMADLLTIMERRKLEGTKMVFAWGCSPTSGNKTPSLIYDELFAGARLGMHIVLACPDGYEPAAEIEEARKVVEELQTGATIEVSHDLKEAVSEADVIHSKGWVLPEWRLNNIKAPHQASPEKYKDWIVDQNLVDAAKNTAIVMHALPAVRGAEITDDVIEGPQSVVFDEAENRLHAQKAILALLMA